jgi:hypothetical protein
VQVNSVGAKVLEYIADFGKATSPLPAAIVACVPKKVHVDGLGETEFKISPNEITDAMKAGLEEPIEAEPEVSFYQLCFLFHLKFCHLVEVSFEVNFIADFFLHMCAA